MSADPRFGEPIGPEQTAGLAVVLKALVLRSGGRVELTNEELVRAETFAAHVDADPHRLIVKIVDGDPPDTPRFDVTREENP